jgi:cytochrome c oxidase subunit IV
MSSAGASRDVVRFAAPLLYAIGFVPVIIGVMVVLSVIEKTIWFDNLTTLRYNGDVAAATSVLLIGGLEFGLLGNILVWLEQTHAPTLQDHLRHCVALYVLAGSLVFLLVATYENQAAHGVSLGYGTAVVALFTASYAIVLDAAVLRRKRRHFVDPDSRDGA